MIEEGYVSFDTAKMLKEAGFEEPCRGIYRDTVWVILYFVNMTARILRMTFVGTVQTDFSTNI